MKTWADVVGDREVRCACRRRVAAADCLDIRALPPEVRQGRDFVCGGCWVHLPARTKTTRHDLLRALGAPADVVRYHRDKAAGRFPPRADERGQG